jgi:parallel beta-helix repeat protein
MKPILKLGALLLLSTFTAQFNTFAQGSLTPPPGAPAPVMKTLDQVEPRIPLNDVTAPGDSANKHIITQPGSYYLTGNLDVTNATGIAIRTNNVRLDLKGFEIRRTTGSGSFGIYLQPGRYGCRIANGSLRGFDYGIYADSTPRGDNGYLSRLSASQCPAVAFLTGAGWIIEDCSVHHCTAGSSFTGISAGDFSVVARCTVVSNSSLSGLTGIYAGKAAVVSDCSVSGNSGGNQVRGITLDVGAQARNCSAEADVSTGESSVGFVHYGAGLVQHCVSRGHAANNAINPTQVGLGFDLGDDTKAVDCVAEGNQGDGFRLVSRCNVQHCQAVNNGSGGDGAGIHIVSGSGRNVIEGNTATLNDRGLDVDSSSNLVIGNRAGGNTTNYDIVTDNKVGVIVAAPNSGPISGSSGGAGVGTTDPWANISF